MTYRITWTRSARKAISDGLPEAVAAAVLEFVRGPLAENPQRTGKRLQPPRSHQHTARRGTYRVIYQIDEETETILVVDVDHRRDIYRL